MIRQCEFKAMYDPDLDMYVTKHIFDEGITNIFDEGMTVGGGMTDVFKAVGKKIFGKTAKSAATKAATTRFENQTGIHRPRQHGRADGAAPPGLAGRTGGV